MPWPTFLCGVSGLATGETVSLLHATLTGTGAIESFMSVLGTALPWPVFLCAILTTVGALVTEIFLPEVERAVPAALPPERAEAEAAAR